MLQAIFSHRLVIKGLVYANVSTNGLSIFTALILAFIATLAACGASGVAVGFIIGVIQDSVETVLNSAGDVMFAATAEYIQRKREGKSLPTFLGGETQVEI